MQSQAMYKYHQCTTVVKRLHTTYLYLAKASVTLKTLQFDGSSSYITELFLFVLEMI